MNQSKQESEISKTDSRTEREQELQTLIRRRRALHQIPEIRLDNPKTAAFLKKELDPAWQIIPFEASGTSFGAYLDNGKKSTLAFRTDTDALPIAEKTGLPFASTHPGKMHACCHDGHMSAMLLCADRLVKNRESLSNNILLLFQSGEESPGGAKGICESGIFQDKNVRAVFGMHLWPSLPKNQSFFLPGPMMAMVSELDIEITGRSAHAARHQDGLDAMNCAVRLILLFEEIEKEIPEETGRILFMGELQAGSVRNTVAAHASLKGTIRALSEAVFFQLRQRIKEAAEKLERETGCAISVSYSSGYPVVNNDEELTGRLLESHPDYHLLEAPVMISEEFSWYQKEVPGVFFFHGTGTGIPLHADTCDFDESVCVGAADVFCDIAFNLTE